MPGKTWIAIAVFVVDRITKLLAARLPAAGVTLISGVLRLRLTRNTGMAFSFFSGHPKLLGVLSIPLILGVGFFLRKKALNPLTRTGVMMLLGGAAGNAADRLFLGYVTDMLEPLFVNFAVFNVADACLVAGCLLILPEIFGSGKGGRERDAAGK
ncbi:MAG: signal peptidase II [Clostridia bacterium]|nr:signal peptidase II [Clostridia bacterium]